MKPIKQQRLAIVLLTLMAASCRSIAADPPKVTGPASAASSVSGPISTSGFGKASFGMNFEDVQRALGPLSRKSDVGRCTIAEPAGGSGGASLHFLENRFVAVSSEGAATRSGIRLGTADAEATLLLKRFPSFQRLSDGQGQTQYLVVATPASAQDRLLRLSLNAGKVIGIEAGMGKGYGLAAEAMGCMAKSGQGIAHLAVPGSHPAKRTALNGVTAQAPTPDRGPLH